MGHVGCFSRKNRNQVYNGTSSWTVCEYLEALQYGAADLTRSFREGYQDLGWRDRSIVTLSETHAAWWNESTKTTTKSKHVRSVRWNGWNLDRPGTWVGRCLNMPGKVFGRGITLHLFKSPMFYSCCASLGFSGFIYFVLQNKATFFSLHPSFADSQEVKLLIDD